jgi:hypothetical protein
LDRNRYGRIYPLDLNHHGHTYPLVPAHQLLEVMPGGTLQMLIRAKQQRLSSAPATGGSGPKGKARPMFDPDTGQPLGGAAALSLRAELEKLKAGSVLEFAAVLDPAEMLSIAVQTCRALQYLHTQKPPLIHR